MISALLLNRRLCLAFLIGSAIYLGFHQCGIYLMECPFKQISHRHCPGCGLTSSVHHILHGDWYLSTKKHLLAVPYLILFTLIGLAAILPEKPRELLIERVERSEKVTYWPHLLVLLTLFYGITRLFIDY